MTYATIGRAIGALLLLAIVPATSHAGSFFDVSDNGNVGVGTTAAGALLDVARPATTSNTELIDIRANGFTQTIASGLTNARFNQFNQYTLSAATAQTVTNGTTLHIAGPPSGGGAGPATITTGSSLRIAPGAVTNTTNAYGLYVDAPTGATNNYAAAFPSGNVGVGTTSPGAKLHVQAGSGAATIFQKSSAFTGNFWIPFKNSTGSDIAYIGYTGSGSDDFVVQNLLTGKLGLWTTGGNITLDNSGNVGIGTTTPDAKLSVNGDLSFIASPTIRRNTSDGSDNGYILMAGGGSASQTRGAYIQVSGNEEGNPGSSYLYLGNVAGAVYRIWRSDGSIAFNVNGSDGNVGIGTTSPGYLLDVAGSAHASSFPTSSDVRLKKNITPLKGVLPKLEKINGVAFDWNSTYQAMGRATGHREVGLIAQEVEAVFPELVTTWGNEDYRAIDYGRLAGILVEAIKEQQAQIRELREEVAALKRNQ